LTLFPARNLYAPWFVLQGEIDQACSVKDVADFVGPIAEAKLVPLPKVGHGFAVARRWQPPYVKAYNELASRRD
jgi:pimeloyl-ACP methyl ester carboxylesterase